MPSYSEAASAQLQKVDDPSGFLFIVIIEHPSFSGPIRIVQDTDDLIVGPVTYAGLPIRIQLPQDVAKEAARAKIEIDNIGREMLGEFERLPPGGAVDVTIRHLSRLTPNIVEYEFVCGAEVAEADQLLVSITLGDDEWLRMKAVSLRADRDTTPGLHPG